MERLIAPPQWMAGSGSGTIQKPDVEPTDAGTRQDGWLVTVFNNEVNTWDEVMVILMVATRCDAEEAYIETWEIDNLGSSVVHHGGEKECRAAADIIATIGIRVEVGKEPA